MVIHWDEDDIAAVPNGKGFSLSGRVLEKIPSSGSGRSVEIYDQVLLGIFFIFGYFRVCLGIKDIISIFGGYEPNIEVFSSIHWWFF